ncbi:anti-sigma factor [Stutzerimonas stutzeri]|uniref:anti-sigma factor family protein n=1 Tax=Stutzerimonas stutzeri TaxID=316 RepID=UPI00210927BE|nr:anti-sigma factor [Stutzerimonas stutzeri]MCQ4321148.1 anti-sigma factor [Stutzerimonas stutzeri]
MLTCKEMSELGSDIIDNHLRLTTRMAVLMHLSMCTRCRRYIKQLQLTADVLRQLPPDAAPVDTQVILDKVRRQTE